ncbi:Kinesin-like protein KIF16B [Oopsacas minuta]|uniref:Kinesin-like protein n=1 Tax=Oopsacas minuta TaxID=111878 RepID=A0AAV7K818_9METZ|nr:Kinesin-like protein KIF16B [Oopsacas minuta]
MKDNGTSIHNSKLDGKAEDKQFYYDHSMWSFSEKDPHFVSQKEVFDKVGKVALGSAFEGYNACIFAYGQTGSGKSYTMMGTLGDEKEEGLIPRMCNKLFSQIEQTTQEQDIQFKTEISYYEIYNEKVQDLLSAGNGKQILKVREHPKDGPYVENLTSCLVSDFSAIKEWMDYGNSHRQTAATMMNNKSSRSHAIFTIKMTMAQLQEEGPSEIISKMHLIDLAGSERAATSGATGERLKEGGNINKSLVTLGLVISKLAEESKSNKGPFVPYRDSVLTRLLKDSLGGNSKTFLIATISPSELNYPESLSTLYFADSAKRVKNRAIINEDPNVKLIKDLRKEIDNLRQFIHVNQLQGDDSFIKEHEQMRTNLQQKEGKIMELEKAWTERWKETKQVIEDRKLAITSSGLKLYLGSLLPHLIELDPRSSQPSLIMYHIKKGIVNVGKSTPDCLTDIELDSVGIVNEHCQIEYADDIMLIPRDGNCAINKKQIIDPTKLHHGDALLLGKCVLKFFNPQHKDSVSDTSNHEEVSDPEESFLSNSPHNHNPDFSDLNLEADMAIYRLNEEKDKEIERLNQQVKDLKEASERIQDRMNLIPDDLSREMSLEDDVFTNSFYDWETEEPEGNLHLDRYDGGVVMTQTYIGSLGTSPFHRMSILSSPEENEGMLTENDFTPKNESTSSQIERPGKKPLTKEISFYFPGSPSSSSDDINTPVASKEKLIFMEPVPPDPSMNRVSMIEVEKMINHEKKKLKLEHDGELFKIRKEKEAMMRQISEMQKERAAHVSKSRVRLNSLSIHMGLRKATSLSEHLVINCSIPYTHLVKKSFFSGTFHIYHVQVDLRDKEVINIYRRYNEFRQLKDFVSLEYPELDELFDFPPRRFLGNKAPAFVAQRQTLLETYLRKVMTYLSCKNSCSISTTDGELPTKDVVMTYHRFFLEDQTDRSLHLDSVAVHRLD